MAELKKEVKTIRADLSCRRNDLFGEALRLHREGKVEEAKGMYGQILGENPEDPDALHMMGIASFQSGEIFTAEDLLNKAVQLCPERPDFRCSLGNVLKPAGRVSEAVRMFEEAIRLNPEYAEAHNNLGATMNDAGKPDEALPHLLQALKLRPDYADASYNLGNAYKGLQDIDKAIEYYNQAIKKGFPDACINLGITLMDIGNEVDAISFFKQAMKLKPSSIEAYNNLGSALTGQGNLREAALCYRKCLEIDPSLHKTHSNLLLAMHYSDTASPEEIFLEHTKWAEMHALHVEVIHSGRTDKKPDKKLRIGYVSPDFRSHPVMHFIEPILASHDRDSFEVFCYSDSAHPDHVTERLKMLPVTWRDICRMTDEAVSNLILEDNIDILIDLAGHTANNRLKVFAQKPALIQATYLGYPDTTGLLTMDYRLVDSVTDPPGSAERLSTEKLVRIPHGFLCYRPPECTPAPGPLPVLKSGVITFGCFNKRAKITKNAINAWSAILGNVPRSRVFLKFKNFLSEQEKAGITGLFMENGISPDRVTILKPIQSLSEHIAMYNRIDIALDTFPYNGTTTTCEALWMGVPVITLTGIIHASRVGTSILKNCGLENLIAESIPDYIHKAVLLAGDLDRLKCFRTDLRDTIKDSPLRDEKGFTIGLENSYRMMWRRWCEKNSFSQRPKELLNSADLHEIEQLMNKGEDLYNSGRVKEAENIFMQILEIDPHNVTAMNDLGVVYWHAGKIRPAIELFQAILTTNPDHADARTNLEEIERLENSHEQGKS